MDREVQSKLDQLAIDVAPLSQSEITKIRNQRRAEWFNVCWMFKNYIWSVILMIMFFSLALHFSFGIVNLFSTYSPFGSPLAIAGTFTGLGGFAFVLSAVIDFLYSYKIIGCGNLEFTEHELQQMNIRENTFFIPGCVYDCRVIQNRIDINTIRYYIPFVLIPLLVNIWINNPSESAPDLGTITGMRYACSHLISMGIQTMIVLCITINLYAMRRRRPRIETLHIAIWFETTRYWEDEDEQCSPGTIPE